MLVLLAACGGGNGADRADTAGTASIPPAEQPTTGTAGTSGGDTAMAPAASSAGESTSVKVGNADTVQKPKSASTAAKRKTAAETAASASAQDTGKKAVAAPKPAAAAGAGGAQSPQQVALGDSIFHGQVAGGTCTACHGQDAKGTAIAPDLTDQQWLNGDGSYAFIVKTVTTGVPQPKQHPAPMPPKGGATLSDEQVKAVAAYVYSLSHKS